NSTASSRTTSSASSKSQASRAGWSSEAGCATNSAFAGTTSNVKFAARLEPPMISRRALELATAILTGGFGVAVVVQSLDNGIGWSSAGVDAGTFPFLTGIIILLGSLYNMGQGALGRGTLAIVRVAVTPS